MTKKSYYDIIASKYDKLYNNNISLAENHIVKSLILEKVSNKSKLSILDIGCGTGLVYEMLSSCSDVEYVGMDISRAMINIAKQKFYKKTQVQFIEIDANYIEHKEFLEQSFDIVSSTFGSFSYIHSPKEFLEQSLRLLKKDGIIFIMVYSQYSIANIRNARDGINSHSIRSKRPYEFRNSNHGVNMCPESYFYTEKKLYSICSELTCSSVDIYGLNYFLDHTYNKELYGYMECIEILKKEMSELSGNKDLAHSLICIIRK